ncbi:MAG: glutamate--tRNA ligase [Clostridia bacterium]|nr:glutamate--tRNA ligase [Clostridia bacterium]
MDSIKLAGLLFPDITKTPDDYEKMFPPRELPEGAKVTRFAPSPTGFVHFGSLFPSMVGERLAHQSGGIFYLRIEDTDSKREVKGAEADIINTYKIYDIIFDEGATADGGETGAYGPYRQSHRAEIYQTFAKKLVEEGKAYPCFCTEEELNAMRAEQEAEKITPGYFGKWAVWRDAPMERVEAALADGKPFVLRFRSEGSDRNKVKFTDLIKGSIELTENNIDHVLLKSDGIPTYHFAHAVDDHLMHTTHVIRGEEWLPSLPFHIQLFSALGFRMPKYLHISQLMKLENGSKKKLSKRDKEAGLSFFVAEGYPAATIKEYVMTLLNSNFEDWRRANPSVPINDFPFSIKKMSPSGTLFDFNKLNDVSKNTIARMTADEVYDNVIDWAKTFDNELYEILTADRDKAVSIFAVGRGGKKPRRDFTIWKDVKPFISVYYDDLFERTDPYPDGFSKDDIRSALEKFLETYDPDDDMDTWFGKIKDISVSLGYAAETKEYKAEPDKYKGHVGDISGFIRIALTGKTNSPDMYAIMQIIGSDSTVRRIKKALELI